MIARVTINAPRRRIDLALPEHVPVAELLPEVLHQAGEGLADEGESHGGWLLRRTGGVPVEARHGLHAQGIRDGEVLHLVPARTDWPAPEYDDVVEAIAADARRIGAGWGPGATRAVAIGTAGLVLATGLAAGPPGTVALAVAVLLALAGVVAARAYGDGPAGAALAAYAMPYAAAGGAGLVAGTVPRLLVGSVALVLLAGLAAGVGAALRLFAGGITAGLLGASGALLALWLPVDGAAAVLLAVLACGIGAVPLLAVRLGNLPVPPVALPPDGEPGAVRERPDRSRVLAAVRRTDELLTGMLVGHALATAAACLVLVRTGGRPGCLLVGVAGGVLLLRARSFAAVRQRLPVLLAGGSALATLAAAVPASAPATAVTVAAVAIGLPTVAAGTAYARRSPSPYLGRAADLLDLVLVVCVVPVACAVLGLYGRMRGLAG